MCYREIDVIDAIKSNLIVGKVINTLTIEIAARYQSFF